MDREQVSNYPALSSRARFTSSCDVTKHHVTLYSLVSSGSHDQYIPVDYVICFFSNHSNRSHDLQVTKTMVT